MASSAVCAYRVRRDRTDTARVRPVHGQRAVSLHSSVSHSNGHRGKLFACLTRPSRGIGSSMPRRTFTQSTASATPARVILQSGACTGSVRSDSTGAARARTVHGQCAASFTLVDVAQQISRPIPWFLHSRAHGDVGSPVDGVLGVESAHAR